MKFLKPSTKLPQNRLVAMAVKRMLLRQSAKAGGVPVPGECLCLHEKTEYNEFAGVSSKSRYLNYDTFANNATVIQRAITLTEPCCVHVVATLFSLAGGPAGGQAITDFELEMPKGTIVGDQEHRTLSGIEVNGVVFLHYSCWEVLPPGVYTFEVVNRSGANRDVANAQMKVVAYDCVTVPTCDCELHDVEYAEFAGNTQWSPTAWETTFANGATILAQVITLTETCCVTAVGTILSLNTYNIADFELEQPKGTIVVDQEDETLANWYKMFHYASYRVLPAGVYTFELVCRAVDRVVGIAQLKLIACKCTLV